MTIVHSRDFQLLHFPGSGPNQTGIFEVGGGFFKFTKDLTYTAGAAAQTWTLWDYFGPFMDADPAVTGPVIPSLYLDAYSLLYGSRAPTPGVDITKTWSIHLCNGYAATDPSISTLTGVSLTASGYFVKLAASLDSPMLPVYPSGGNPTIVSLTLQPSATVANGTFRFVANGRFL